MELAKEENAKVADVMAHLAESLRRIAVISAIFNSSTKGFLLS